MRPRTQQMESEARIRQIGAEMLERARRASPSVVRLDHWMGRLLDWATREPQRKVRLFQFVDTLPSLDSDEDVVGHLAEYLLTDGVPLPRAFRSMLRSAADGAWFRSPLASATRHNALRMARQFIAGETADEALDVIRHLRDRGMGFTLDLLGEATSSDAQADTYASQYLNLLHTLTGEAAQWAQVEQVDRADTGPLPRVNVSLKLSSLDPHYDPICSERSIDRVLGRLRPILRAARQAGAFVNVDMEQYAFKDLTLATFQRVLAEPAFQDFADVGIVLQAYLADTAEDLERLLAWVARRGTPITVRLVKGAYWDYETASAVQHGWRVPVLTQKWECDAQFERLARRLLDQRSLVRPAIASHNVRSLAAALAHAQTREIPARGFEIQMLFGMGDPLKQAVAEMGYTLRVYTPIGELIPGMAYLIRRLLENTSNESFLKHTFVEHQPVEVLLADPATAKPGSPPPPRAVFRDPDEDDAMHEFKFEPLTDFTDAAAREAMQQALDEVAARFDRDYPLVIDGQPLHREPTVSSWNPSKTTQAVGRVCLARVEDVQRAVAAARRAFDEGWGGSPAAERADLLRTAARIMGRRRFELAAWIVYEVAKPWREADADVAEAIDFCNFYADEVLRLEARPRRRDFPGQDNLYVYRPRGVAAVIAPWNFPLAILAGMTSAALAAGNTVVMKPAEQSSVVAAMLMEVLAEAGVPPGVVNYLPGTGETVGAALVEHPQVDIIAFTGSRAVGVQIHERAAGWTAGQLSLKRVIAEMGGKNAIVVDADADLDEAIAGILASAFGYAGQKCSACSRVIVHESIMTVLLDRLVAGVQSLTIGPATAPDTQVGPLIDAQARDKVLHYLDIGNQEARLAYQADVSGLAAEGTYAPPTIFADVPPDARIAQEEIFGPVVTVLAARSFEHAIELANATPYGLTGGVYSRSPSHLEQAKRDYHVGNLYLNQKITGALVDRQPFGGLRMSGIGSKAGGPDYLIQFMEPMTISENTMRHGFAPTAPPPAEAGPQA